ncbi:MAG TPA: metalloregulator ArsR/SmtB family transcription factor [Pseudobacillus sp.]
MYKAFFIVVNFYFYYILELLADGDKNVNEIQTAIGSEGSSVSQQLSVLRSKNIVYGTTKDGNRVVYSLRDPMIIDLLKIARQIFNNHLIDTVSMLDQLSEGKKNRGIVQR